MLPNVDSAEAPERFFDFSEFPNLQEVEVEVGWAGGSLQWIPIALSTLGPTTSPRLSTIRLNLNSHSATNQAIEIILKNAGSELRRVADELARIEREFEGAVNLTVPRNPGFKVVFDALDVRFHFCGVKGIPGAYWSVSYRSFTATLVEIGSVDGHHFTSSSWSFCRVEPPGQPSRCLVRLDTDFGTMSGQSDACGNGTLQFRPVRNLTFSVHSRPAAPFLGTLHVGDLSIRRFRFVDQSAPTSRKV